VQISTFRKFSTSSFSYAPGLGRNASGQRFRTSVGWPPSSERDQVVGLVPGRRVHEPVGGLALALEMARHRKRWTDGPGVPETADRRLDVGLGDARIHGSRGTRRIRERPDGVAGHRKQERELHFRTSLLGEDAAAMELKVGKTPATEVFEAGVEALTALALLLAS
jgi:hypothetical protein